LLYLVINVFFFVDYLPEDDQKNETFRFTTCLYIIVSKHSAFIYIYYIYIDIYVESYEEKIHRQTGLGIRWTHS